jgi:hypothetical protein
MAMFSRFFVLGPRGDTLVVKEYQGHISPKTATPQDFWSRFAFSKYTHSASEFNAGRWGLFFLVASPCSFTSPSCCRVQESSELSPVIDINGVRYILASCFSPRSFVVRRCIASRSCRMACSSSLPQSTTFLHPSGLKC